MNKIIFFIIVILTYGCTRNTDRIICARIWIEPNEKELSITSELKLFVSIKNETKEKVYLEYFNYRPFEIFKNGLFCNENITRRISQLCNSINDNEKFMNLSEDELDNIIVKANNIKELYNANIDTNFIHPDTNFVFSQIIESYYAKTYFNPEEEIISCYNLTGRFDEKGTYMIKTEYPTDVHKKFIKESFKIEDKYKNILKDIKPDYKKCETEFESNVIEFILK